MSNYDFLKPRERHQSLFIVEGYHEKFELIKLLLRCFPEIYIKEENIVVFETNIYALYEKISKGHEDDWESQDVDLLMIMREMKGLPATYERRNFSDVFLIFDYERHDPNFSEDKIIRMQRYFKDSVEMGKLYINYPMVESYTHFPKWPDDSFKDAFYPTAIKKGKTYKTSLSRYLVSKLVALPQKLDDILRDRFRVLDEEKRKQCVEELLLLQTADELLMESILSKVVVGAELQTVVMQIRTTLKELYLGDGEQLMYYEYMKKLFQSIIRHNIYKANWIMGTEYNIQEDELRSTYYSLEFEQVLQKENEASRDDVNGVIWVLNTSVFFVTDYKFALIE